MSYAETVIKILESNGFKTGAKIRFGYFNGSELVNYEGEILNIRLSSSVKEKNPVKSVSLYLVVLKTAEGIKSFWEANMTGVEVI